MESKISLRQIILLLFVSVTTTYSIIDMPKFMAQSFERSSWLPIIAGAVIFACAATLITKINTLYQGQVFFDYTSALLGKFWACVFGVFYVLYFIVVEVNLNIKLVGILNANFLPRTPYYIFLLVSIGLSAYLARKGLVNVCRLIEITGIMFLIVTLFICIVMITSGDKNNILPFFNSNDFKNLSRSVREIILPFAGVEILLIVPFVKEYKGLPKKVFFVMLLIGLFYILMVEGTVKILGPNNTSLLNDAFFEAVKSTPAPIIERLDVIYLTFGLGSLFTGFGVMFVAIIEHACKVFSKVNRNLIIAISAVIVFALSIYGIKTDAADLSRTIIAVAIVFAVFVIPLIVFMISKIKDKHKEVEV